MGHGCHGTAVGHGPGDGGVLGDNGGYHAVGFEVMAAATQALEVGWRGGPTLVIGNNVVDVAHLGACATAWEAAATVAAFHKGFHCFGDAVGRGVRVGVAVNVTSARHPVKPFCSSSGIKSMGAAEVDGLVVVLWRIEVQHDSGCGLLAD